jgi:uncharacterized protein (TIGR03118 family)
MRGIQPATLMAIAAALAACGGNGDSTGGSATLDKVTSRMDAGPAIDAAADEGPDASSVSAVVQSLVLTPIVTDQTDPLLINPWGLAFNPAGLAWVADNKTGVATVYPATGAPPRLTVTIPRPAGTPPSAPTGTVFSENAADFSGDRFLFATEDGTIAGWQSGTAAVLRANESSSGAIFKGLSILNTSSFHPARLYAPNFHAGRVDVFDTQFRPVARQGAFVDRDLPSGFAPFNVSVIGPVVLVSYAKQDEQKKDDVHGTGNGVVDAFDLDGDFIARLISGTPLNSPFGIALAPSNFGNLSNTLLVGNFGDGLIHAFRVTGLRREIGDGGIGVTNVSASLLGPVGDTSGRPLSIDGLWALRFGVNTGGFSSNILYFNAGPGEETHGIFGSLSLP